MITGTQTFDVIDVRYIRQMITIDFSSTIKIIIKLSLCVFSVIHARTPNSNIFGDYLIL